VLRSDAQRDELKQKVNDARHAIEVAKRNGSKSKKSSTKPKTMTNMWRSRDSSDDDDDDDTNEPAAKSTDTATTTTATVTVSPNGPAVDPTSAATAATATAAVIVIPTSKWWPIEPCIGFTRAAYLTVVPGAIAYLDNMATPTATSAPATTTTTTIVSGEQKKNLQPKKCPVKGCGKPATKICGRCRKKWFCSLECQRYDWTAHQSQCIAVAPAKQQQQQQPQEQVTTPSTTNGTIDGNVNIIVPTATSAEGVAVNGYVGSVMMTTSGGGEDPSSVLIHRDDQKQSATSLPPPPAAAAAVTIETTGINDSSVVNDTKSP
jgi:hypothetical protein